MDNSGIEIANLNYEYNTNGKTIKVLDDINLKIKQGEKIGILGPNGSGKSTLIKIIAGIIQPKNAKIKVLGYHPGRERKKLSRNYSVLFGQRDTLWPYNTIKDNFELMKKMYKIPSEDFNNRIDFFNEYLEFNEFLNKIPLEMSLGQKVRCKIVGSLLHYPKLYILDEATIGLDLAIRKSFIKLVNDIHTNIKNTIILSSHNISDLEICDKVIVMMKGKIIYEGKMEQVKSLIPNIKRIVMSIKESDQKKLHEKLLNLEGVEEVKIKDDNMKLIYNTDKISSTSIMKEIVDAFIVQNISEENLDNDEILERIFRNE